MCRVSRISIAPITVIALFTLAGIGLSEEKPPMVREIFVPLDQLDVLLENQPKRVLLNRTEYEDLLARAKKETTTPAPRAFALLSANYTATVAEERATITGTLIAEVFVDGLQAIPLEIASVGVRRATSDAQPAAIGHDAKRRLTWFVSGKGRHELVLDLVAPLETTAARQVLLFQLPRPPAVRFQLSVPGDVEIKGGADVIRRELDPKASVTRFDILPAVGQTRLLMTLNSRLKRHQRAVSVQSVLVDEVTEAYERIHATIALKILHRAVDQFRFVVPEGFDVTDVSAPELSRWAIETDGPQRILDIRLREQATGMVVLNLSAIKSPAVLDAWTLPKLEPLDVVGQSSVVGLLVDERLDAEAIAAENLVPINTDVLSRAIPETVFQAEPGAVTIRPVVAYYAPQGEYSLSARFTRPEPELHVTTNVLLTLSDRAHRARGQFVMTPSVEKLFGVDFSVPAGWHVERVTDTNNRVLAFERYGAKSEVGRIRVWLPDGISPDSTYTALFHATATPKGWLDDWQKQSVAFPIFGIEKAETDVGAIAVAVQDDLTARLAEREGLTPLDESEKSDYGLGGVDANLLYRYETRPYRAVLEVERTEPRLTARTFSSLKIEPDALSARYEVAFHVEEARARQVALLLPESTPASLSIRGLDEVKIKEYRSEPAEGMRRWNVLLEKPQRGTIRLALDFKVPLPEQEPRDFPLPLIEADGVAYQSGLVSVEANAELEVDVKTDARRVDIGELVEAEYQPGRGLLGVFGFVGDPVEVKLDVFRRPGYRLDPAIAERADLVTQLSPNGLSLTTAHFQLRTKASYLQIELPKSSELWSAELDAKPVKPQREGDNLLISLPADANRAVRELRLVYQRPVPHVGLSGKVHLFAPTLRIPAASESDQPIEVPLADLGWRLRMPIDYEVTASSGTVVTRVERPEPAVLTLAKYVGAAMFTPPPVVQCAREANRHEQCTDNLHDITRGYTLEDGVEFGTADDMYEVTVSPSDESVGLPSGIEATMGEAIDTKEASEEAGEGKGEGAEGVAEDAPESMMEPDVKPDGTTIGLDAPDLFSADLDIPLTKPPFQIPLGEKSNEKHHGRSSVSVELSNGRSSTLPGEAGLPVMPDGEDKTQPTGGWGPKRTPAPKPAQKGEDLTGFRSLKIELAESPYGVEHEATFQSLGVSPRIEIGLVQRSRLVTLGWVVFLAVLLIGVIGTCCPVRTKVRSIAALFVLGTLVALIPGLHAAAEVANMAVFAAAALVPYYLVVGMLRYLVCFCGCCCRKASPQSACTAALLIVGLLLPHIAQAAAPPAPKPAEKKNEYKVEIVEPTQPVTVPDDAVILPYDPDSETGIADADRMLVPYEKYIELWNRAYPDEKLEAVRPPAEYALAGAEYTTTLEGEDYLELKGSLQIDLFTDAPVAIPLRLAGGVLSMARVDGKPARLSVPQVAGANLPNRQAGQQKAASQKGSFVLLHVRGKGRHPLEINVQIRLDRRGGWRIVQGQLPAAPATALRLTVPDVQTEVQLGNVADRRDFETTQADESIETVLGTGGSVTLQWRPKVAEGEVDRTLTAQSDALLDVQEDGLRLRWQLALEFRRSQHESFRITVPKDYLVEKIEGTNVRGWEVKAEAEHQTVDVTLLNAAKKSERFTVHLWRAGPVGTDALALFDAPVVLVPGASLHHGLLTVRRSSLLEIQAESTHGVRRTDLRPDPKQSTGTQEESALPVQSFQAYRFAATPFALRLAAKPVAIRSTAEVKTIVRIADLVRSIESRFHLQVENRPLFKIELLLPKGFDIEKVFAPGDYKWAETARDDRPLVTVYLATGQVGPVEVRLLGTLAQQKPGEPLELPRLEVLDAERQSGDLAIQVDPATDVQTWDLKNCERTTRSGWLQEKQRRASRLVLHTTGTDYGGTLKFVRRKPRVGCETITNVRITDRAVEETILLDYSIENAGIREISFLLPSWQKDCRISVPMLRQKTIEPVDATENAMLRVHLELQGEVMGDLKVRVKNDRLLTDRAHAAPIPVVETGRTDRRYVVLQSAGRDEVIVERSESMESLNRKQPEWARLRSRFGVGITQAYLATAGDTPPEIVFRATPRTAWKSAGARIGLAETMLVFDASGAYRAVTVYRLDNTTEQSLEISLPSSARLWTAQVAGEPVKPTVPDAAKPGLVRIPLFKTAPGDLDYPVVLKYGGKLPDFGHWRTARSTVRFPLIRTRDIKVELSQVRLFLPDTHRWFDFGGTMSPVKSEGDLKAGSTAYEGRVGQRLLETLRSGSEFAQVRSQNNLKNLQLQVQIDNWGSLRAEDASNPRLQAEYARNAGIYKQAQQEIERLERNPKKQGDVDNRFRLDERYTSQQPKFTDNAMKNLGYNWDEDVGGEVMGDQSGLPSDVAGEEDTGRKMSGKPGGTTKERFNLEWFDKNKLNPTNTPDRISGGVRFSPSGKVSSPSKGRPTGVTHQLGASEKFSDGTPYGEDEKDAEHHTHVKRERERDVVKQYQKRLEQTPTLGRQPTGRIDNPNEGGVLGIQRGPSRTNEPRRVGDPVQTIDENGDRLDLGIVPGDSPPVYRQEGIPATGLASLDVELPQRGNVYRFTMPQGEIEITARAISNDLANGLFEAALIVTLVLVVWVIVWTVRRGTFRSMASRTGATILIVIGILGLVFLPLLAFSAILLGIFFLCRHKQEVSG